MASTPSGKPSKPVTSAGKGKPARGKLHTFARLYAEMGWAVFPLLPKDKRPATSNGFKEATTDLAKIDAWWGVNPQYNIGIATGQMSGLVVLDIDTKHGASLEQVALLTEKGMTPPTKMVVTGTEGYHLYFRQTDGDDENPLVPSSVGREYQGQIIGLAPGLDVRGEGGYVVAPPSVHPETGREYRWADDSKGKQVLPWPAEFSATLAANDAARGRTAGTGQSVVGSAPTDDARVREGRNNFLTSLGGKFRSAGLSGDALLAALDGANLQYCEPPLDDAEVKQIASSVQRYKPREDRGNVIVQHLDAQQQEALAKSTIAQTHAGLQRVSRAQAAARGERKSVADLLSDDRTPLLPAVPLPDSLRLEQQEREIIAAILADAELQSPGSETLLLEDVATILKPRHFYDAGARSVYAAMFELDLLGKPISLSLVDAQAKAHPDYPGLDVVRSWITPTLRLDFDPYVLAVCRVVEDAARKRALVALSQQLQADALGLGDPRGEAAPSSLEIAESTARVLATLTEESGVGERDLPQFINEYRLQLADWQAHAGQITGASTGLRVLDRQTNGIQPGDLWVVGGRASMGKTSYALTLLTHNAIFTCAPNEAVGIVTLEMSGKSLIHRMVGMLAGYSPYRIMTGYNIEQSRVQEAIDVVGDMPLHIMDATTSVQHTNGVRGTVTPEVVRQRVKAWQREHNLKLLVVDYLQLLRTPPGLARSTREQQVAEMCAQMKRLAQECHIPVVLLAQLSRATEARGDRLPQMSDIRESGGVEQDADVILMLFRQSYYADRGISISSDRMDAAAGMTGASLYTAGKAQIKIEKNRNGPVGVYDCYFDAPGMRYYDWDDQAGVPVEYDGSPAMVEPPKPARPDLPPPPVSNAMGAATPPVVYGARPGSAGNTPQLAFNPGSMTWDTTDDTDDD